jgi:type II secretory pathway predicted ATPase ExeA
VKRIVTIIVIIQFFFLAGVLSAASVKEHYDLGSIKYLTGDYTAAAKALGEALKLDPNYLPAKKLLESIYREKKLPGTPVAQEAKEQVDQADKFLAEGFSLYEKGEYLAAANYFQAVSRLTSRKTLAPLYLQQSLVKLAETQETARRKELVMLGGLVLSVLFFALLFSFAVIWLRKRFFPSGLLPLGRRGVCFHCGSRISPNIDLCPNCGAWTGAKMKRQIRQEQDKAYHRWGWKKNPFTLDIHPELFTGYRQEVKSILEKISAGSGHILITGPLGVGKTTLLRWLKNHLEENFTPVYVPRPPQHFAQLIRLVIKALGMTVKSREELNIYNLDVLRRQAGQQLVVLLDEAHEFTVEIERPLRTLGDLDGVVLVMAGLPETVTKFQTEVRPLFERIVLSVSLDHLDANDLKELIRARIESVGGSGLHPFTEEALAKICEFSGGIPRRAVKLCDRAVTRAIQTGEETISVALVA